MSRSKQDNRKSSAEFRPMPSYEGVKSQCFIGTGQSLYNCSHTLCSIGNVGVPIGSKRVTFHVTWPHVGLDRSCFVIGITMRYIKNSYTGQHKRVLGRSALLDTRTPFQCPLGGFRAGGPCHLFSTDLSWKNWRWIPRLQEVQWQRFLRWNPTVEIRTKLCWWIFCLQMLNAEIWGNIGFLQKDVVNVTTFASPSSIIDVSLV